jgi:hypothetical protein
MAVRPWRTSSSLNGLMIATTSFMVRPSFLAGFLSADFFGSAPGAFPAGSGAPRGGSAIPSNLASF